MDEFDLASARRAAASTYTRIEDVISLYDGRDDEARIELLANHPCDALLVVGGIEGGATGAVRRLVEAATLASYKPLARKGSAGQPPTLVYAGNSALHEALQRLSDGRISLAITDNLRPRLDVERLQPVQDKLESMYESHQLTFVPGFDEISLWTSQPALTTARAFGRIIQFLSAGEKSAGRVLGIDVGSASTVIAAGYQGALDLTVRTDLGVGHSAARLLDAVSPADVVRWLPYALDPAAARDFAWNKSLQPGTVPQEAGEIALEQALAREAIRIALHSAGAGRNGLLHSTLQTPGAIIAAGSTLARAPRPGQTALMLLDTVQPVGVTRLFADANGLMPALGAIGVTQPVAVVQTLEKSGASGLQALGTAIAPSGGGVPGEIGLRLELAHPGGGKLQVEVRHGSLEVVPLPAGEDVPISLELADGLTLDGMQTGQLTVMGGSVGLIVDLRGRPLRLPGDPAERAALAQQWLTTMGS
jgi:hypothetical protein